MCWDGQPLGDLARWLALVGPDLAQRYFSAADPRRELSALQPHSLAAQREPAAERCVVLDHVLPCTVAVGLSAGQHGPMVVTGLNGPIVPLFVS